MARRLLNFVELIAHSEKQVFYLWDENLIVERDNVTYGSISCCTEVESSQVDMTYYVLDEGFGVMRIGLLVSVDDYLKFTLIANQL